MARMGGGSGRRKLKRNARPPRRPAGVALPLTTPGVYDLAHAVYHADPCPVASLSASIAHILAVATPRHAWLAHPRLNPNFERRHSDAFDLGEVAHELVLGVEERISVIDAENYRTEAARDAKAKAYAASRIPVLTRQLLTARAMASACHAQLARHADAAHAFAGGKPERTLVWEEDGVWFRIRPDMLPAGGNVFFDYKSTGGYASPEDWGKRQLFDHGGHIRAALYMRGFRKVLEVRAPVYRFVVQETKPPFPICVQECSPHTLAIAEAELERAIAWWRWCRDKDVWPGYPRRVCYVEPPAWVASEAEERKSREQYMKEQGEEIQKLALDWQAPLAGD